MRGRLGAAAAAQDRSGNWFSEMRVREVTSLQKSAPEVTWEFDVDLKFGSFPCAALACDISGAPHLEMDGLVQTTSILFF